jgi:redox-sensitive bicupin YhaK (pirin superfamily)
MFTIRPSTERGLADHGWLYSKHSFSFANYYDPKHMGFRNLRVINEDIVAQNKGFGTHGHQNMEIISYVIEGKLAHKDSMGTGSVITSGDIQRMSAGTGVRHSEYNASSTEMVHFLQIWILPNKQNILPSYEEKHIRSHIKDTLCLIASPYPTETGVSIQADALLYAGKFNQTTKTTHSLPAKKHAWIQMVHGSVQVEHQQNSCTLYAGDGLAISNTTAAASVITLHTQEIGTEFLLFELV